MTSPFQAMLEGLLRLRGVTAALLVDEHEGMIVDSVLQFGQDGDRVAALAASLHRKARLSSAAAGLGAVSFMQLEAEAGRICAAGRDDMVLVVVAASAANVGLVRVEMLKAVRGLG
ncbi:MAG TPA: roadblock/LC7 domain-containing protein [Gemmatimonadaceae bacterium]|nr:roadblock/LC7 domain-containing protein [Gemmatimonadaceae bacterium]